MKSIRTDPRNHGLEGDERIRTAVCAPSDDPAYETRLRRELRRGNTWTESDFGGLRIYWCWWAGYGAMGGKYVKRVLIGRVG